MDRGKIVVKVRLGVDLAAVDECLELLECLERLSLFAVGTKGEYLGKLLHVAHVFLKNSDGRGLGGGSWASLTDL